MDEQRMMNEVARGRWKPYPAYKPSGVEWLGDIPAHWEVSSLRRNLRDGNEGIKIGPFGSQLKLEDMQDSGWKVYGQENVIARDFRIGNKYISDAKFKELATCAVRPGDLVVSMMGTTGRCCVVPPETEPGLINSHLIRLRVQNNKLLPEYAALLIDEAHYVREQINAAGKGAIMQGLNSSIVKELTLVIPSIIEQRAIAAFLDRETAKLDTLIAKHERLIELLQEKHTALISHAVTKGLDPSVPMKDSRVAWLGQVPAHWEIKRLGAVAPLLRGHDLTTAEWQDGHVPVISSSGLSGYHNQAKAKGPGVVTGRYGTVGKIYYVEQDYWPMNTALYVYDFKDNYPRYIYYLLMILPFDAHSGKSAVPGIDRNDLHVLSVCQPSRQEQEDIAAHLDRETAKLDALIARVREGIEKLREYRAALISAAVTGKIMVARG